MTKRSVTLTASLAALLLLITAWFERPAIWRYLYRRQLAAARVVVADYLDGRLSFDTAAMRLNARLDRAGRYVSFSQEGSNGGGSLTAIHLAPPGYREDDPRISALFRRGMILGTEPANRAEMERTFRHLDSLEAASHRTR